MNGWKRLVKRDGSGWLDGWPRLKKGKMTNHKKHNNITHTKRWEERRWKALHICRALCCGLHKEVAWYKVLKAEPHTKHFEGLCTQLSAGMWMWSLMISQWSTVFATFCQPKSQSIALILPEKNTETFMYVQQLSPHTYDLILPPIFAFSREIAPAEATLNVD